MVKLVMAIDQGTTSSRSILFDGEGHVVSRAQKEFTQHYPEPGQVEHDPRDIWSSTAFTITEVIHGVGVSLKDIAAVGITNQRETTLLWDRKTGQPLHNAIVWQDRRTAGMCDTLISEGHGGMVRAKTGLIIDAYFSATKLAWLLDHIEGARDRARRGELAFGTVDTWLIWQLTGGQVHATDVTNASRTMLFNIHESRWDEELIALLDIPRELLPDVHPSSGVMGEVINDILPGSVSISGIAGDQQAALFGQACFTPGLSKMSYGTGGFLVLNTGTDAVQSRNNLLTTVAWDIGEGIRYALEGSVYVVGAVVQWLRDGLGIIRSSSSVEPLANTVKDNGGVFFVPAFTGLGAPYWDPYARGTIVGLTRGTEAGHIARAALECMAYQTLDVLRAMEKDAGRPVEELRVDGGAAVDDTLLQFQADIAGIPLVRPAVLETTALGAAYLAGLAVGVWKDTDDVAERRRVERVFEPAMPVDQAESLMALWHRAVERSLRWEEPDS
ncbi:MAG: glycerol kinase GlpK [bacterium]